MASTASPFDRLKEYADIEVRHRSTPIGPMYVLLFLCIVYVTPITRRFMLETAFFGTLLAVFSAVLLGFCLSWRKTPSLQGAFRKKVFHLVLHAMALVFGVFCAFTIAAVELSWTSFFVVLITCGICAGMASILAPNLALLRGYLAFMLAPAFLVNVFHVGGLRGYALGSFFAGFSGLLLWVAKLQNTSYWENSTRRARLQAMVDAIPGTLVWVSSDLKYLGLNRRTSDLWHRSPAEFIGKAIGFADPNTAMLPFARDLFASGATQFNREIVRTIDGQPRNYLLAGTKYNFDTEAVIIGLDVTEYQAALKELSRQKEQVKASAQYATLGEIVENLADELNTSLDGLGSALNDPETLVRVYQKVSGLQQSLKHVLAFKSYDAKRSIPLREILEDLLALFTERFKKNGVQFKTPQLSHDLLAYPVSVSLLPVMIQLLSNAFDAVQQYPVKWVNLGVQFVNGRLELDVTDSGTGIPVELQQKIFDPLFSTKKSGESSGVGLTMAKSMVEAIDGTLSIDSQSANTRFVIQIAGDV